MTPLFLALAIGLVAGWMARGQRGGSARRSALATRAIAAPELLPEPALRWLMRAHDAIGAWMAERGVGDDAPSIERVIDADRLGVDAIVALDRRVEAARDSDRAGVERVHAGTLVVRTRDRLAAALLLPPGPARIVEVEEDLDRLLEGLRRRPEILALAQRSPEDAAVESVASVGLRLAFQLERITNGAVVVASNDPDGPRVVGVSGYADRRLLGKPVPRDCDLDKVARGELERGVVRSDPLGGVAADRRQRSLVVHLEPIMLGREVRGAAALWLPGGVEPTGPRLAEIVEAINEAGARLARAQHTEQAERGAFADPLTGLANRAALQRAMHRAQLSGGAVIALDIDHFKRLNDGLGHAAGDAALVHVAQRLRENIRSMDTAARVGGEEFVVWLPDASLEVGTTIAQRIHAALGDGTWEWQGTPRPLTASLGVSACPDTSRSIDNLLVQADQALYRAKESGRNRVEVVERL